VKRERERERAAQANTLTSLVPWYQYLPCRELEVIPRAILGTPMGNTLRTHWELEGNMLYILIYTSHIPAKVQP
jgi:hypothetical protein